MNIYNFDVNFTTGRIYAPDFILVVNDHNSTLFKFTFDQTGRYVFKLLYPDGTVYVQDIADNQLKLTKGVLNQEGNYKFEISLYGEDNRLTTARIKEFPVRLELVSTDEPVQADDRLPILDNLIEETNKVVEAAKNGELDGATFTPSVSDNGDLSWTNDKGKENPPTVNIAGPPGAPGAVKMQVVDTLPDVGETDTIYLVKKNNPGEQNLYDEYVYTETSGWEHIGDTSVDLTDYYTKEETDEKLEEKQNAITTFFIDIPSQIASEQYSNSTKTLPDSFNTQLTTIINNIFGKYQTFSLQFFMNNRLVTFNPSYTNAGNYGTPVLGAHPSKLSLFAIINDNKLSIENTSNPTTFFKYIPVILTIEMTWSEDTVTVTSSKYRTYGNVDTIPSVGYINENTLKKTNTTAYTPTSDYHPATKKYVDDNKYTLPIASADTLGGIKIGDGLSANENGVVSAKETMKVIYLPFNFNPTSTSSENKTITDEEVIKNINQLLTDIYNMDKSNNDMVIMFADKANSNHAYYGITRVPNNNIPSSDGSQTFTFRLLIQDVYKDLYEANQVFYNMRISFNTYIENNQVKINDSRITSSYNCSLVYDTRNGNLAIYQTLGRPLGIMNTNTYNPTSNYNPSTKLYTDKTHYEKMTGYDATKTQVLKNINGTLTWVDEV